VRGWDNVEAPKCGAEIPLAYEQWLLDGTGIRLTDSEDDKSETKRSIICHIMDWSDDVAFAVHDLEDGLIAGFLQPLQFAEDYFAEAVHRNINRAPVITKPNLEEVREILKELTQRLRASAAWPSKGNIREVCKHYINRFVTAASLKEASDPKTVFDFAVDVPDNVRKESAVLKAICFEFVILDERSTTFAFKGKEIVRRLFEALKANTMEGAGRYRFTLFPRDMRDFLDGIQDNESALARAVCDYVASLTDGQALHLYRRLFEPLGGSPFEPI